MNRLSEAEQELVIKALVEGNSIRSTVRMTGIAKNTITKLLVAVGDACEAYHRNNVKHLKTKRIQCDEIWSYCYSKDKNVPKQFRGQFGYGDVWTFTCIDADTKLCVSWYVGPRTTDSAETFMMDIHKRIDTRVQITTDSYKGYETAINAFKNDVDYGVIAKTYGRPWYNPPDPSRRYSPNTCTSVKKTVHIGSPDRDHISTSYVERQNLTMRMSMRRFTRLTNGFSKKLANLEAAIALHFVYYNYCRIHQTLRVTPAMEAGITDHVWGVKDLLNIQNSSIKAA